MLIACWSAQGGAGTTVVAVTLSLLLSRRGPTGAVLADLAGDGPGVLGLPEPATGGLAAWLRAGDEVPADGLHRLEIEAGSGLAILNRGTGPLARGRSAVLSSILDRDPRPVVADCGNLARPRACAAARAIAQAATRSLLIVRPSYLSLRNASEALVRASDAVVVGAGGRTGRRDVERALGVPVTGHVPDDPAIATAVDAGLVSGRLPRALVRGLEHVA